MPLAKAASCTFGKLSTRRLDPANTFDGSDDACAECGSTKVGDAGKTVMCCNRCPRVWHRMCIPKGWKKPPAERCSHPERTGIPDPDGMLLFDCPKCPKWYCGDCDEAQ